MRVKRDMMYMNRFDEAIRGIKQAHELDPLSLALNRSLGQVFYYAVTIQRSEVPSDEDFRQFGVGEGSGHTELSN